ncbi:hypothetical protein B7463_g6384, partial [Scytalidium lignicola]
MSDIALDQTIIWGDDTDSQALVLDHPKVEVSDCLDKPALNAYAVSDLDFDPTWFDYGDWQTEGENSLDQGRSDEQTTDGNEIDMNDPIILGLYSELLLFSKHRPYQEMNFTGCDSSKQRNLLALALKLGLQYSFNQSSLTVTISQPGSIQDLGPTTFPATSSDLVYNKYDTFKRRDGSSSRPATAQSIDQHDLNSRNYLPALPQLTTTPFTANPSFTSYAETYKINSDGPPIYSHHRTSSAHSADSRRGRSKIRTKLFSPRRSAEQRERSSSFAEFIFDSQMDNASRNISQSPGRRGPLDKMSCAGMKALKIIGACWRCKILRKKCNPEHPCKACPKAESKSLWHGVGCRRGGLSSEIDPVVLCPKSVSSQLNESSWSKGVNPLDHEGSDLYPYSCTFHNCRLRFETSPDLLLHLTHHIIDKKADNTVAQQFLCTLCTNENIFDSAASLAEHQCLHNSDEAAGVNLDDTNGFLQEVWSRRNQAILDTNSDIQNWNFSLDEGYLPAIGNVTIFNTEGRAYRFLDQEYTFETSIASIIWEVTDNPEALCVSHNRSVQQMIEVSKAAAKYESELGSQLESEEMRVKYYKAAQNALCVNTWPEQNINSSFDFLRLLFGGDDVPDQKLTWSNQSTSIGGKNASSTSLASESDRSSIDVGQLYLTPTVNDYYGAGDDGVRKAQSSKELPKLQIHTSFSRQSTSENFVGRKRKAKSPPRGSPLMVSNKSAESLFERRNIQGSSSPATRTSSYSSLHSFEASTSSNFNHRLSTGGISPLSDSSDSLWISKPRLPKGRTGFKTSSESDNRSDIFVCKCCPKEPKRFQTRDELKNRNETQRHMNSLHLRQHSWSCSNIDDILLAFQTTPQQPLPVDTCGYCGQQFLHSDDSGTWTQEDVALRESHLKDVHMIGACNQEKRFFRADHFRQHLKHSHRGVNGSWTNRIEELCMHTDPDFFLHLPGSGTGSS